MKGSKIMAKYKDQVSEATEELSESVREANKVIADSAVAASERNWKFAQSVFEDEVELFKSHAESTRTVMEKLVEASEKGQPLFQSVAESMVAAQERNVQFVQGIVENGTEVLRSHVEGTRTLMQTLTEQSKKQREAFSVLARGTWDPIGASCPHRSNITSRQWNLPSQSQCIAWGQPKRLLIMKNRRSVRLRSNVVSNDRV